MGASVPSRQAESQGFWEGGSLLYSRECQPEVGLT